MTAAEWMRPICGEPCASRRIQLNSVPSATWDGSASASRPPRLSQVRKLTVLSRGADGALAGMTWDLDHISRNREWLVIPHADPEALEIADTLGFTHQGTMVLWRNTDRLGDGPDLRRRVTDAGKQLSLLFHRFMADGRLSLYVGQHQLRPMDPYLLRNALTQDRGFESLEYDGYRVTVNPVVLPHPARLTREESLLASGPGGLLGRQGFYVYRGDRLVVAGGWLGLPGMHNTAYTRLAQDSRGDPAGRRPDLDGRCPQIHGEATGGAGGQAHRDRRGRARPLAARLHSPWHADAWPGQAA